jgi:hypothetical protein
MLVIWYSFMGALAAPIHGLTCILFSTMFRVVRTPRTSAAPARPAPAGIPELRRPPGPARPRAA